MGLRIEARIELRIRLLDAAVRMKERQGSIKEFKGEKEISNGHRKPQMLHLEGRLIKYRCQVEEMSLVGSDWWGAWIGSATCRLDPASLAPSVRVWWRRDERFAIPTTISISPVITCTTQVGDSARSFQVLFIRLIECPRKLSTFWVVRRVKTRSQENHLSMPIPNCLYDFKSPRSAKTSILAIEI